MKTIKAFSPLSFPLSIFCCLSISCNDYALDNDSLKEFDLSYKGVIISNCINEMMTQCPAVAYDYSGVVYVSYYNNPKSKIESALPDAFCKLARFDINSPEEVRYVDILKTNDIIGDFTVGGDFGSYDPQLIIFDDYLLSLVVTESALEKGNRGIVSRRINKNTLVPDNSISKATLEYIFENNTYCIPMFEKELSDYVDKRMCRKPGTTYFGRPTLSQPIKYGGYYYSYLGGMVYGKAAGLGYPGTLVRTEDGIHWEEVSCPTFWLTDYNITDMQEVAIEIKDDTVFVLPTSKTSSTWLFTYHLRDNKWGNRTTVVSDCFDGNRTYLFKKRDHLFAFVGVKPDLTNDNGTNVIRTRMRVCKYDYELDLIEEFHIVSKYGIVYPIVFSIEESDYMICAENRRWKYSQETGDETDPSYPCSDIALVPLIFLNEI